MVGFVLASVVFPVYLLPFSLLKPGLEPHCALYTVDILGAFRALNVLLGELGLYVELTSLLGIISVPCL